VFGSGVGMNFSDNAKYQFLYCSEQLDIKSYWISKNKELVNTLRGYGLNAYYKFSIKGIWISITSKVYVYDSRTESINHWTSAGSYKVNLWHGSPLKTIDRDINVKHNAFYIGNHTRGFKRYLVRMVMPEWFIVPDFMIATSEKIKNYFKSAFGSHYIEVTGYPRNDIIINPKLYSKYLHFEQKIKDSLNTRKTILYTPTFRDTNRFKRETPIIWYRLNELLSKHDTTFLIKLHRHDYSMLTDKTFTNIQILDSESDVYPIFEKIDLLITDYSSIFFDFILTDKPVLFYAYDKENYIQNDRSMYDNYEEVTPGNKVYNFEDLYTMLNDFLSGERGFVTSDYNKIKLMYNQYNDDKSCERVFNSIKKQLSL
jgi:CDP-glycerol glycerophosphotransferase (TagB/SpsB family)